MADRSAVGRAAFVGHAMISIPVGTRVLIATRPIDFRRGAHSLAALAAEMLGEDPFSAWSSCFVPSALIV